MVQLATLVPLLLISLVEAGTHNQPLRNHARSAKPRAASNSTAYSLVDLHQGTTFFDGFDFFSSPDPTHGMVNYQTAANAKSKKLAYVQADGTAVLGVDNTTKLAVGAFRNSVRISSKKTYSTGLIIADFLKMPHGCSVWPAWWTVGPVWPDAGEIDIIEGVNGQSANQYALHSGPNCMLNTDRNDGDALRFTGFAGNNNCTSDVNNNAGCIISEVNPQTFGQGFNDANGGVYALLLDATGIRIWFFSRANIPADINAKKPDPTSWGVPNALYSNDRCDIASHFYEQSLVLDTTLCGDWAGNSFPGEGCSGSCAALVADPSNYNDAKWAVNYIAVYS